MLLDLAVCLPKEAETIGYIRRVATTALHSLGVTQECIDDICLGLSEACNNVVEHAVVDDEYEVRLQIDEEKCAISVKNTGYEFDAAALHDAMPDPLSPRGRGVAIMRAIMDQVDFTSQAEAGTIVTLVKTLTSEPDGLLGRLRRENGGPQ